MHYWLSTLSPPTMLDSQRYETPELAALLREAQGVDPAMLAAHTGVCAPLIRAYQRKLGLRPISNPRHERKERCGAKEKVL